MSMFCKQCGKPGSGRFCSHCGGTMSSAKAGNAFTWPFFQRSWLLSVWMPTAWAIPFVGNLLALGWSVDAIRRRALDDSDLLPQPEDIVSHMAKGFVVFVLGILLLILPLLLIGWLMSWSWLLPIWDTVVLLWKAFWHQAHEKIASYLLRNALVFLSDAAAPTVFVALAAPLFFVGRLRYAITGEMRSFFRLFANTRFCLRFIGDILLYFFLSMVLRFAFLVLAILLLAIPVFGQLLPFVLGGVATWMRAYWAGGLACKMRLEVRTS